jgi:hypothetical protein
MLKRRKVGDVIWKQRGAHWADIRRMHIGYSIGLGWFAVVGFIFGWDVAGRAFSFVWLGLMITIGVIALRPRIYLMTPEVLAAMLVNRLALWSLPLQSVVTVKVVVTRRDRAKATGTIVVQTTGGRRVISGIRDPDQIAERIRTLARERREALKLPADRPVLAERSALSVHETADETVIAFKSPSNIGMFLVVAAICLTFLLLQIIPDLLALAQNDHRTIMIALAAACAIPAVLGWIMVLSYLRSRLVLRIGAGALTVGRVPSLLQRPRTYDLAEVRNLRAITTHGEQLSAREVFERWGTDDPPFFPGPAGMPRGTVSLAFDYEGRTVTIASQIVIGDNDMMYLLWRLGQALPPARDDRKPELEVRSRLKIWRTEHELLIEAGPRRDLRMIANFAFGVLMSVGFLIMITQVFRGRIKGGAFGGWAAMAPMVIILLFGTSSSLWNLARELFGTQVIHAASEQLTCKSSLWPWTRRMAVQDIQLVVIRQGRIYLRPEFNFHAFSITGLHPTDLVHVSDLLRTHYASRLNLQDKADLLEGRP